MMPTFKKCNTPSSTDAEIIDPNFVVPKECTQLQHQPTLLELSQSKPATMDITPTNEFPQERLRPQHLDSITIRGSCSDIQEECADEAELHCNQQVAARKWSERLQKSMRRADRSKTRVAGITLFNR